MTGLLSAFGVPESWRRRVPFSAALAAGALLGAGLAPAAAAPPGREPSVPPAATAPEPAPTEPLTAADAVTAAAIARLEDAPVEILAERTEYGSVYVLPDGTRASGQGSGPVWVREGGDGTKPEDWAPVDLTLERHEDGTVRPVAQSGDLTLAAAARPDASGGVDLVEMTDPATGIETTVRWEGRLPEPRLEGRRAVYPDVQPGVDLVLEATSTGFEQFFVLEERPAAGDVPELPLTVVSEGAAVTTGENGALALTAGEEVVATSAVPLMWDAESDQGRAYPVTENRPAEQADAPVLSPMPAWVMSDDHGAAVAPDESSERLDPGTDVAAAPVVGDAVEPVAAGAVEVERAVEASAANVVEVTLTPQDAFLQDPATTYPVVVDPDVNFNWGFDTYVLKGYSNDRSGHADMSIGTYDGGAHVARSFIHFPTGAIAGRNVLAARMELFAFHSWSCQARNWQVWSTSPSGPGSTWNAQPAWHGHYTTSSQTTGYSASCNDGWINADVTTLARDWANGHAQEGYVGVKAENEGDNYGWKRVYQANNGAYIPSIWVTYNSTPNVPSGLGVQPATGTADGITWTNTLTPRLSATVSDPDGENVDANFYLFRGPGAHVWGWGNGRNSGWVPNGAVASKDVPAGTLVDNETYFFFAAGSDWKHESAPSARFTFGVDATPPTAPLITSTDFPDDNEWRRPTGTAGKFTLTPSAPDASIVGYRWALDKAPDPNQVVATVGGAARELPLPAQQAGRHVLQVQAVDRAGNLSPVRKYAFNVGLAGIVAPEEGTRVVRRVPLRVQAAAGYGHVSFEWRRGPDSGDGSPIPAVHLTTSTGRAWSAAWQPLPTGNAYTTWDVGAMLEHEGGPVQVRAKVSKTADGEGPETTQWVTLVVDPDADGAAATEIGPGSVNLLTGDHGLSVTDVEEFGLSVVRTTSSRDTDAGYQELREQVPDGVREGTAVTSIQQATATAAVDSTRFHTGTSSIRVNSRGGPDSYASIEGDVGPWESNKLGLRPGGTYRVSAWVLVPATTGLTPETQRGLGVNVFWLNANGTYNEPGGTAARTPMPTKTGRWQYVTTDVTIPGTATQAFARLYNGFSATDKPVYFDDVSIKELVAPFGKEWALGTADDWSGTAYTRVSRPYEDVAAVHLTGGGEIWFTSGDGVKWWPEPGAETLRLTPEGDRWRLTEIDGTYSLFARAGTTGDYVLHETSSVVKDSEARYVWQAGPAPRPGVPGTPQLTRIIAPREPGVTGCEAAVPALGCKVVELEYATTTTATTSAVGDVAGQVKRVHMWSSEPGATASTRVAVAAYAYDGGGRLRQVHDPRLPTPQVTVYEYDPQGRIATVTAPGEKPYRYTYGQGGAQKTGAGDWVDAAGGRLLKVTRASLTPGSRTQAGPDNVTTVVYGVPLTRSAGGPYDLHADALATWAQQDAPTDATAVFGPQDPPTVTTATATAPGRDGYRSATVHYLNPSGLEVNTASPAGPDAPAEGFLDTAEYDGKGRVVRTLDATNRLLALGRLPESAQLPGWGLVGGSAAVSQLLDTRTSYTPDGMAIWATRGPAQRLAVGDDPNTLVTAHTASRYAYDEGRPATVVASWLPTRERTGAVAVGADATQAEFLDSVLTVTGYDPVDGAAKDGLTSGWVHQQATSVTVDAEGEALRATTLYDTRGRVVSSSKPGSKGADAATSLSVLYTADASASDPRCRTKPAWAGQPCVTRYAAPAAVPAGAATRAPAQLTEKHVPSYNFWGSAEVTSETANGQTRSTRTTYDPADRVSAVEISGSVGAGTPIARTTTTYDPVTGDVVRNATVDAAGTVTAAVSKEYDDLGRLVRYTDSHGGWTSTEYDRYGQPVKVTDSLGTTRTYAYDRSVDPRGYVTTIADSVGGTITPTWGPDGQLQKQTLPGGVIMTYEYDAARVPVARTYTRASDGVVIWRNSVVENHRGQWVRHTSTTGTRTYDYDSVGRLAGVDDVAAMSGACTSRRYVYDVRSNRTSFSTATGDATGACPGGAGAAVTTSTYDDADRLISTSGANGQSWTYDALGRTTAMPTSDGSGVATTGYFVNDLVASQEVPGVERATWSLDPLQRFSTQNTFAWVNGAWANSTEQVIHYDGDGDEPGWIVEDRTQPDKVSRWVEGADGQIAVQTGKTGGRVLQLVDLHGDVVGTLPIADGGTAATWSGLQLSRFDEFGVPTPMSGAATTNAPPARYGWLGAAQRSADTPAGVLLMGVRLYHAAIGRFLQVDPVAGGSANAYDYCNADPVNCTDLGGTFTWKGLVKAVAVVGEAASMIPGPIGAAAGAVSAVAYAASGNKGKALLMGVTAAAALVGAGAAVKAVSTAVKAGRAARACNSFVAGTLVRMADGSARPIEELEQGDRVLARDPLTGQTSSEVVIAPIWSTGTKHLVRLEFDGRDKSVLATAGHPFWIEGEGWVDAADLRVGDLTVGAHGALHAVRSRVDLGELDGTAVFNLHTAGAHTYFVAVGGDEYLVHNSACSVTSSFITNPAQYRGASRQAVKRALKKEGWRLDRAASGGVKATYAHARHPGVRVLIEKGHKYPVPRRSLIERGPYIKVQNGKKAVRVGIQWNRH